MMRKAWCTWLFIVLLHLIVLHMSIDIQSKPFPYRLVFIDQFSFHFLLVPQTLQNFYSILSHVSL